MEYYNIVVAPGYRFYPTEEELISFYLQKKLVDASRKDLERVIPVRNIYDFSPWDLPKYAGELCNGDPEQWFFFVPGEDEKREGGGGGGGRVNRLTREGYWKATGSPGMVYSADNKVIGVKRTMVFYQGRAPTGSKTIWKMNEYTSTTTPTMAPPLFITSSSSSSTSFSISTTAAPNTKLRQELSLCRVYIKSKCLRSFDRRPPAAAATTTGETTLLNDQQQQHQVHVAHEVTATTNSTNQGNYTTSTMMIKSCSTSSRAADDQHHDNSSSSGDHAPNCNLHTDNLSIWDLDLDWDWATMFD